MKNEYSNIKKSKKIYFSFLAFFMSFSLLAQTPQQNIRGEVHDVITAEPYAGVSLFLLASDAESIAEVLSDEKGNFIFKNIPIGRYQMRVEYVGYQSIIVSEVLVRGGKETILKILLEENNSFDLETITVKGTREAISHPVSIHTLTIEETLRFPATYFDPARLAITLPGVVNTNDQSNGLSIRGHSPNALSWRLEGAEIVNPNHTPNAGTASDRVTLTGGGVNMLSAQMLGNTTFLTGAFPSDYGNALGAVMDMNLREGNRKEHEFTAQIGLIGIDLAAEGPFGKNKNSGFSANYRYSTVGLLSQLGVDLGDEEISFQDLAFKADFLNKKGGKLSLFAIIGTSKNLFAAQRDSSAWEFQKDRFDIKFKSTTAIEGISYEQSIGDKSYWKTSFVYSGTNNTRTAERLADDFSTTLLENDVITYQKAALHSVFSHKLSASNHLKFGLDATVHTFDLTSEDFQIMQFSGGRGQGILWQPYAQFNSRLSSKLSADIGLHVSVFGFNNTKSIEPRAALKYQLNEKNRLGFAYGLHSQMQLPQLYLAQTTNEEVDNQDLELTKAHHFVLSYNFQAKSGDNITVEAYYQKLFDIPEPFLGGSDFSALNLVENFTNEPLQSTGSGRNVGLEVSWQKYFTGKFYYLINTSVYDAKYTDVNGNENNTRYNGNYIFNATGGKEWTKLKGEKAKTFGVNIRVSYAGGFRYTPIDIAASLLTGATILQNDNPFSEQFASYFKTDARLYWKKSKAGRSTVWALDLQNLTNQENAAFRYFDTEKGEIVTKNQLGLLPILSWKIEF
ncbi:MAG: hypothetical protein ACI85O_000823 [Saprospiraceae bacterium]|jgi:hypothetical protein